MNLKFRSLHQTVCASTTSQNYWDKYQHQNLTVWWKKLNAESEPHLDVPLILINSFNACDDKLKVICSDLLNGHFGALCAQAVRSVSCSFCRWACMFYTISDVQLYNFTIVAGIGIQNLPLHWGSSFCWIYCPNNPAMSCLFSLLRLFCILCVGSWYCQVTTAWNLCGSCNLVFWVYFWV
jgi:hypothetical protein